MGQSVAVSGLLGRTDVPIESRVIGIALFIPLAMLFISWFVPLTLQRGVRLGKVDQADTEGTAALSKRLRRVALFLLLIPAGMITALFLIRMT